MKLKNFITILFGALPDYPKERFGVYCGTNTFLDFKMALGFLFNFNKLNKINYIKKFEKKFAKICKFKYAVSFGAARMAIYSLLKNLNIKKNDEVILPAFTCAVVPNAIIYAGAKPVYVDIEDKNFNINANLIKKKITKKTKIIYVQNTFGVEANFQKINKIAKKYNLLIIEDNAHRIEYQKKKNPRVIASIYSLDHSKIINTHLGGMLLTNNNKLFKKLNKSKINNKIKYYELKVIFSFLIEYLLFNKYFLWFGKTIHFVLNYFNFLFYFKDELSLSRPKYYPCNYNNFAAKIGLNQLKNLSKNMSHRRNIVKILESRIKWYKFTNKQINKHSWLRYSFLVKNRNKFEKIYKKYFNLDIWYKDIFQGRKKHLDQIFYKKNSCPVAEFISNHIVNFPTHLNISKEKLIKILDNENLKNQNISNELIQKKN